MNIPKILNFVMIINQPSNVTLWLYGVCYLKAWIKILVLKME